MNRLLPFINASGISMPLASLRYEQDFGIGDIKGAYIFVDFLAKSGQGVWKILPLNESSKKNNDSPYDPISAFAMDKIYIDITSIQDIDYVTYQSYIDAAKLRLHQNTAIDYEEVRAYKIEMLRIAFASFYTNEYINKTPRAKAFEDFMNAENTWLDDYILFKVITKQYKCIPICDWPDEIKRRDKKTLVLLKEKYIKECLYYAYIQWIFDEQWHLLLEHAHKKQVAIVGDMPFYVGPDSADVWAHAEFFCVDKNLVPLAYGGAPPDAFSPTGQIWTLPVYDWNTLSESDYAWWINRLKYAGKHLDGIRLDHFRGFIQYWKIDRQTGQGVWVDGPGEKFLQYVVKELLDKECIALYAENLGYITKDVEDIREVLGIPGYSVFLYSFKDFLAQNVSLHTIAQTTTHDTDPLIVWWKTLSKLDQHIILSGVGLDHVKPVVTEQLRWRIIEKMLSMHIELCIFPVQDILGLTDRVNVPYQVQGAWSFRMPVNIEVLSSNYALTSKLDTYANIFNVNKYHVASAIRTIPWINEKTKRTYTLGEDIHIWAYVPYESDVRIVTNLPISQTDANVYEKSMQQVFTTPQGSLYHTKLKANTQGIFYLTVRMDETYASPYKQNLTLVIE